MASATLSVFWSPLLDGRHEATAGRRRLKLTMDRVMKGVLYVVIALAVAYLWLHFEAPHYNPFQ
jgi:hypothetical protein